MRNYHKRPKPSRGLFCKFLKAGGGRAGPREKKKNGHNLHFRPVVRSKLKIFPACFLMHTPFLRAAETLTGAMIHV